MTRRQLTWLTNITSFLAFAVTALFVRPWWGALILLVLFFAATVSNFMEGRLRRDQAERCAVHVISPRHRYSLAGPGGMWAITHMSTRQADDGTATALIKLIPTEEWERLRDARPTP